MKLLKNLIPLSWRKKFREKRNAKKVRSFRGKSAKEIFTQIYAEEFWGDEETVSGSGSKLAETKNIRHALPGIFRKYEIKSLLDLPCGDFNWMKKVDLDGIEYLGGDIVHELIASNAVFFGGKNIQFAVINLIEDPLPKADLLLCRDCLGHFSNENISKALENFRNSGARYLAITSFPDEKSNRDIVTGDWRPVNLEITPFHLSNVKERITENSPGKFLLVVEL